MLANDLVREGQLDLALAQLQAEVRKNPSDGKLRIFLFQLLAVTGQWERAATQLGVVGDLDAKALPMVQTYRTALDCEVFRASVFSGDKTPLIFGEPEDWIARMIEAIRLVAQQRYTEAERLRNEALEQAPAVGGEIDAQPFEWIADADSRLGPLCEAIINGKYYWIPFHRLQHVTIEPPEDLRDFVWMPVRLTFANGGESVALIPTRYPGSETDKEGAIRLSRKTDWVQVGDATYLGHGQRMLATDSGEFPLLDVRRIAIGTPGATAQPSAAGGA